MAVSEKALTEGGPGGGAALVPPQYGVGDKCPECGMAMLRLPSGEVACKQCGFNLKKAVGFVVDTVETKAATWSIKEAQLDGQTGLMIRGYASTWMEDRDGDTVARSAFDQTLKTYLADNPVLLLDHKREQVLGDVKAARTDDVGLEIEAFIPKPESDEEKWKITAYRDIKRGLRKALSIGGVFYRASEKSARNLIEKVDLFEISNIAVPSNPKSLFRVISEKGLSFGETKGDRRHGGEIKGTPADAPAEDDDGANDLVHTHAKPGGGVMTHKHDDAVAGHAHEGALPMVVGKKAVLAQVKASADDDNTEAQLAQTISDAIDDAINSLPDDPDSALSQMTSADESMDALLELLNSDDSDDESTDAVKAAVASAAKAITDPKARNAFLSKYAGLSGIHPIGGTRKMGDEIETKGAASEGGSKTVTLSATEYETLQKDVKAFQDLRHTREVEETAEAIATQRATAAEKAAAAEAEGKQAFMQEVAAMVELKMAGGRSGRKYISPASGEQSFNGGQTGTKGVSMVELLYRKSQGDQDARNELREMSQKAAGEYGMKALYEGGTSGYLVPPQYLQNGIAEYRIAAAKVRQLCTVIGGIGTNLVYIPRETGIATVGWTAEGAPKPSTDQTFGQLAVNIFTLAGISKVSKQLLDDSTPAVDMLVRKDLGRLLGQAEDIAFLTGTGAGQPTGILNTTGILTGVLGAATIADALASAIAAIQANYFGDPEAIVMNPKHLNVIRTAKDSNLRYIFEPSFFAGADPRMRQFMDNNGPGGANGTLGGGYSNMPAMGGPQGSVWGLPVYADANLPAPTNLGNIIVGAFSEAYVLERSGVTIDVSAEAGTSFEQNQVWYRGEERLGFTAARQPTAFYVITTIP